MFKDRKVFVIIVLIFLYLNYSIYIFSIIKIVFITKQNLS